SFGDSTAQPPTPKRTPISTVLPSPGFETPTHSQGRFDELSGWTPRFAEEYSVFNATPGNLRGSRTPFPDFGPATPCLGSANQKRSLSTDGIGLGVAVHGNELSPNPSLPLPSVEPSTILRSSPALLRTATFDDSGAAGHLAGSVERSAKKYRRSTVVAQPQGQTATPPPSARKGERKLAPKGDTSAMQNEQDYGQQAHFMASAQQQGMGGFMTPQGDVFGYPLSAPAAAPTYGAQRPFWDSDPSLAGMDIDFTPHGDGMQPATQHHGPELVDWARTNQLLPDQSGMTGPPPSSVDNGTSLVSQPPMSMLVTSSVDHSLFAASYPNPVDDPFGISDASGVVNPGVLFSRPQSANLHTVSFNNQAIARPTTNTVVSQDSRVDSGGASVSKTSGRAELRRSASAKDATPRKPDWASASSLVKEAGRPGLSRSFSENRGKKTVGRPSLPPLAPRPRSQLVNNAGVNANKPVISQPQRPSGGRSSPSKSSHHHHRLSSLSSIPETSGPQMRTQAKFTIDSNGRARVETTVVVVDEPSSSAVKRHCSYPVAPRQQWYSSDDDDSSTDDEPIIIPSRNTSFALPDPRKPTTIHPFHNSQRSMSEYSTMSYTSFQGPSHDAGDSDGETIVNDSTTPTRKASGDALSELRKLRETRQQKPASSSKPKRFVSSHHHYSGNPASSSSPTTVSEASLPTPTADTMTPGVRCVCNRAEAGRNDLLVQCESCEMYVHGQCVSITQRTMPSIYICAFCSNTPNMRGGKLRDNGRLSGAVALPGSVSSPLAHKSLKSFR
ncbi:hypothetical protein N657DRAFT_572854, partial [Parathielavia appendiculata]